MSRLARHALTGLALVLLQWLVFGRLRIFGAYPDAPLLYVAWLALHYGRKVGTVAGFLTGLLLDVVTGLWGLHTFVKTLVGFLVGLFPASERETLLIQPQQAFVGSLVIALLHNGLFVILLALQNSTRSTFMITGLWLGGALYTAFLGTLAALFSNR